MPATRRRPLVVGNWKMNLNHLEAIALVQKIELSLTDADLDRLDVVVLPAFPALRSVQTVVEGERMRLRYGAQDLSPYAAGAYTGDVSGPMLAKLGCAYVTVGHSERRRYHGETDAAVNAKLRAACAVGLTPILCVGEDLEVRRAGGALEHVLGQLDAGLADVPVAQVASAVVAYEPVWAIGTGETATPGDAQEVCAAVRARLAECHSSATADAVRLLYGGSVSAVNAGDLLTQPDVDGALVGGASLDAAEFVRICRAA